MMNRKGAGSEGGLPTTTIVIIAIVIMLIATALIFLALPYLEEEYGDPGKCDDTCFLKHGQIVESYVDCDISTRKIIYYPDGPSEDHKSYKWHYQDFGYTTYYDPKDIKTLSKLIERVTKDYNDGVITENSYHWFMCTAEAID